MLLETASLDGKRVRTVNCTDASFDTLTCYPTRPSEQGTVAGNRSVVKLRDDGGGQLVQNGFLIFPIGVGTENATFTLRVYGIKRCISEPGTELWFPFILGEFTCTLSTFVGLAGKVPDETNRFCDTIALVTGNDDVTVEVISPANNTPAHIFIDAKGTADAEFAFAMGGSATSGNAIICGL